jgi:hypothetical protein
MKTFGVAFRIYNKSGLRQRSHPHTRNKTFYRSYHAKQYNYKKYTLKTIKRAITTLNT